MHLQLQSRFTAWTLATLLLAFCSLASGQGCGDGIVDVTEECDDNDTISNDGCNSTCMVEDHFECTHTNTTTSVCIAILLDLNSGDNTTLNHSLEYFEINTPVFLVNPDTLDFFISPEGNWTHLDVVILEGNIEVAETVEVDVLAAEEEDRITSLVSLPMRQIIPTKDYPSGVSGRNVTSGIRVNGDSSDGDSALTQAEIRTALLSVIYQANEEPIVIHRYSPRDVCLIAVDPLYNTTACITLYYVGSNSNPPTIVYEAAGMAQFTEGQSDPVPIVTGNITVQDDDHPTRFLIESASASILGFTAGQAEWLSLITNYTLPNELTSAFDNTTGTLTIAGNATTDVYYTALQQLTYFNNMSEPEGFRRSVEVTVDDGQHTSSPATIEIIIININDNPRVSLNGETPVIMSYTASYTEGDRAVTIVPNLYVVDTDPDPVIISATVTLTNPVDGDDEILNVADTMGLTLNYSSHSLVLSGAASPDVYTEALRTLTYEHRSANPGNPSDQPRILEFSVQDNHGATSMASNLTLTIIQVKDAPMLSYTSGGTLETYSYIEDDPAINIGQNMQLTDVDSQIMSLSLYLTNLLDGSQDSVGYDYTLLEAYTISVNSSYLGWVSVIVFDGVASDTQYEEILRSLTYTNLHTNDSVTDGQRSIAINATDTHTRSSNTLTLLIDVSKRNDGPAIDLGDGDDAGFTVTYTENGPSVAIGLNHLIQVMDEEGHNISSMFIELISTNGELDEGDLLFLRTPMALPLLFDPNTAITNRSINISLPGESAAYSDLLQAVRYVNTEPEPTLFVNGSKLTREIVIRITDATILPAPTTNEVRVTVQIEPINDNAPRIIINSDPVCTEDCRDSDVVKTVTRRSATPLIRGTHRRHRRSTTHRGNTNSAAAPQILEIKPNFSHTKNSSCLSEMVVVFNTDTNAPVVEIQQELNSLLTFAPASLAKMPHYGYWSDYKTLVVVFRECVRWEREEGEVEGHSKKPLYVVFYGQEGSCDWDSPCNQGVCYYNRTGCPVAGYHRVRTSIHNNCTYCDVLCTYTVPVDVSGHLVIMLSAILLVALATALVYECKQNRRGQSRVLSNIKNPSLKIKPVIASHVIDIHVPAVSTSTSKSPPPLSSETKPAEEVTRKVPPLEKDEHLSLSFVQTQETEFTTLPAMNKNTSGMNSPRKPPLQKRASPRGTQQSPLQKQMMSINVGPAGDDGQGKGESRYTRDTVREGEDRGEERGGERGGERGEERGGERGGERGEEEGGGNVDALRGDGEYTPAVAASLQASSRAEINGAGGHWQAQERGSVARAQGYHDMTWSREHSKHSHRHQQYNDSTQHPH